MRSNFTILANVTLCDANLSWEARGMLAFLLSKPDHWVVNVKHLVKESPSAGRDKVYSILKELETHGYLTQERLRDESGHYADTERVVHEISTTAISGFAVSGSAVSGKSGDIVSTEVKKELNLENSNIVQTLRSHSPEASDHGGSSLPSNLSTPSHSPAVASAQKASKGDAEILTPVRAEAVRLCNLLSALMVDNGCKEPNITKRWVDEMEWLMRKDDRSPEEVEDIIRWCQADSFWKANIRSSKKLREKFDALRLRAETARQGARPRGFSGVEEFLREAL